MTAGIENYLNHNVLQDALETLRLDIHRRHKLQPVAL